MAKKEHRQVLIDVFNSAIFLYDDKMLTTFNYKEGTKTITFDDEKVRSQRRLQVRIWIAQVHQEENGIRKDAVFLFGERGDSTCNRGFLLFFNITKGLLSIVSELPRKMLTNKATPRLITLFV